MYSINLFHCILCHSVIRELERTEWSPSRVSQSAEGEGTGAVGGLDICCHLPPPSSLTTKQMCPHRTYHSLMNGQMQTHSYSSTIYISAPNCKLNQNSFKIYFVLWVRLLTGSVVDNSITLFPLRFRLYYTYNRGKMVRKIYVFDAIFL